MQGEPVTGSFPLWHITYVCAKLLPLCLTLCNIMEPTRLLCPWDSPGKNTGVGCHTLLQEDPDPGIESTSLMSPALTDGFFTTNATWGSLTYIHCVCMLSCSVMSYSLWPHGLYSTRLLCPWDSPGKNTGIGRHALLQAYTCYWYIK